jgi:hypothetical protein
VQAADGAMVVAPRDSPETVPITPPPCNARRPRPVRCLVLRAAARPPAQQQPGGTSPWRLHASAAPEAPTSPAALGPDDCVTTVRFGMPKGSLQKSTENLFARAGGSPSAPLSIQLGSEDDTFFEGSEGWPPF